MFSSIVLGAISLFSIGSFISFSVTASSSILGLFSLLIFLLGIFSEVILLLVSIGLVALTPFKSNFSTGFLLIFSFELTLFFVSLTPSIFSFGLLEFSISSGLLFFKLSYLEPNKSIA